MKQLRTTRANLNTQKGASGLLAGEIYLITDENKVAIATDVNAYFDIQTVAPKVRSYTPDPAGTATLDLSDSNIHVITMPAGNITIALSNVTVGQVFSIEIIQDGTGSRTVTWFTTIKWAEGGTPPSLTTTASKKDTFVFRCTSSGNYDGYVAGQNV